MCLLLAIPDLYGQEYKMPLNQAGVTVYRNHIVVYGVKRMAKTDCVCIYYFGKDKGELQDSIIYPLVKKQSSWLPLNADTLHGALSIHLQATGSKSVQVLRISEGRQPRMLADIEISRLNSASIFGQEKLIQKNVIYDIISRKDSSGIQYYLNRYILKTIEGNYEYQLDWQFPFDKKDITCIRLIRADEQEVYACVQRQNGNQNSLWVLSIRTKRGELKKALRVDGRETGMVTYGAAAFDKTKNKLLLCGQKSGSEAMKTTLWICECDSNLESSTRNEFPLQISPASKNKFSKPTFIFSDLKKMNDGGFEVRTQLYMKEADCFYFCEQFNLQILRKEENLAASTNTLTANQDILFFYRTPDKLDMNGRICGPDFSEPLFPVLMDYSFTDTSRSYLLSKKLIKKKMVQVASLKKDGTVQKLNYLAELPSEQCRGLIPLTGNRFAAGLQTEESGFLLRIYNW